MYDKLAYLRLRVARLERLADLRPGLGTQDPCYILERAKKNKADISQVQYVKEVLEDLPLLTHESGRVGLGDIPSEERDFYRLTYRTRQKEDVSSDPIPYGKGNKRLLPINITGFTLSQHAQFRMDLRGVTVQDIEEVLRHWQKVNRAMGEAERLKGLAMKSREDHDKLKDQMSFLKKTLSGSEIRDLYQKLRDYKKGMEINHKYKGIFVGFVPQSDGTVDIKTVFNEKNSDQLFSSYDC